MRSFIIRFMTILALAMTSGAGAGTFVTAVNTDTTAPVFATPPAPQSVTASSAVITWNSDKIADSRVYFGEAQSLLKVAGEIDYATAHSVTLTKLQPNTTYSYQVVSVDPMGNQTTSATQTFTTDGKANQTISFGTAPAVVVGGTGTVTATSTSGLTVTYSTTALGCSVNASTGVVTGVAAGTNNCSIVASQAGDASYSAATPTSQSFSIGQGIQTITFGAAPTIAVGSTGTLSATGGAGGIVVFTSLTSGICTVTSDAINGNTVTGITTGTCTIAANQAGDASYNAATQVTQTITIGSAPITPVSVNLALSWNLLGNSVNAPLDVATTLGDTTKVTTVWKWIPATSKWAFYAPSMSAPDLAAYAVSKGYDVLTTINGGEGFWVNAKSAFTLQLQAGASISTSYFQDQLDTSQNKLVTGWNLITTGDTVTPSAFNQALSLTPPAQGVIPLNVTTLWAWDSALMNWYFYAPSLEANGGLVNYITTKGYLDFTAASKMLGQGVGFWVNKP